MKITHEDHRVLLGLILAEDGQAWVKLIGGSMGAKGPEEALRVTSRLLLLAVAMIRERYTPAEVHALALEAAAAS